MINHHPKVKPSGGDLWHAQVWVSMRALGLVLLGFSSVSAFLRPTPITRRAVAASRPTCQRVFSAGVSAMSSVKDEIKVVHQPDQATLESMGVLRWPTWGCEASKFPWTYGEAETCYILEGEVTVTPTDGRAAVTVGKGDLVTFPEGMSCTWDVTSAIRKHYKFH